MAIATGRDESKVGTANVGVTGTVTERHEMALASRLTSEQVWQVIAKFAVLGYVTPAGVPRSSGVVYKRWDGD